ncbi:HAD-IA family hydrolase [Streptomyces sp. MUM 203J]|uniref:HAD-IA family hydrolase n=1 Tax=Streptomyces sp. MUM 203J TaxID=2791990 RepID=UPI001F033BE2|nr:HAD-IA family hydrolase [Streptomyces sp. MUM 203J]MCH0538723.1 HAD-IA family hydrolase [Streptomyces sp. MUM 203J]
MRRALILDCDGVLVDAEQTGHLRAFNEMWRRLGVPWQWTAEQYAAKLAISGGKERLASLWQDASFRAAVDVPSGEREIQTLIRTWHKLKTDLYVAMVEHGEIRVRAGVRRLAREAVESGWALAVASSGSSRSVTAVVRHALGDQLAAQATIVSGDNVRSKKPAPDVYVRAASLVGVAFSGCLVIEDNVAGLTAALRARMTCVVTPTRCPTASDFTGAAAVLSSLGSSADGPMRVLANEARLSLDGEFRLSAVDHLLLSPPAVASEPGRRTSTAGVA